MFTYSEKRKIAYLSYSSQNNTIITVTTIIIIVLFFVFLICNFVLFWFNFFITEKNICIGFFSIKSDSEI